MLSIFSLGQLSIQLDGQPFERDVQMRRALLLTYLAESKKSEERAKIARLLWPDDDTEMVLGRLRKLLSRMRSDGFDAYLSIDRQKISLRQDATIDFDLDILRATLSATEPPSIEQMLVASKLWSQSFLGSYNMSAYPELESWRDSIQREIHIMAVPVCRRLVIELLGRADLAEALWSGEQLIELNPYDDEAHALYMQVLIADKQIAKAIRHLEEYRSIMRSEFPEYELSSELKNLESFFNNAENRQPYDSHLTTLFRDSIKSSPISDDLDVAGNALALAIPSHELIGREKETQLLLKLLADGQRLISIVGMGGVGKTFFVRSQIDSLARQQASRGAENAIYFVDLRPSETGFTQRPTDGKSETVGSEFIDANSGEDIDEPLVRVLASTLPFSLHHKEPAFEQLTQWLQRDDCTLILDNFESMTSEAPVVAKLINTVPNLTVIITSRMRLNLMRESLIPLDGLAVYDSLSDEGLSGSLHFGPAVRLFERAAQRLQPNFQLTGENGPTVALLCEQLGGLPLAIEVVSRKLNFFTVRELITDLHSERDLLSYDAEDIPEQHRSIHKLIEQMWLRLSKEARQVLPELTRFAKKWDRQAMQFIAPTKLKVYTELLNSSMVQQVEPGVFTLHPLIKRFATERRAEIFTYETQIQHEYEEEFSYYKASEYYTEALVHTLDEDSELRYELMIGLVETKRKLGEFIEAEELSRELLDLVRTFQDKVKESNAHLVSGHLNVSIGNLSAAIANFEKGYGIAKAANLPCSQLQILIFWIHALCHKNSLHGVEEKLALCHSILHQCDDSRLALELAIAKGHYFLTSGAYDRAVPILEGVIDDAERLRRPQTVAISLMNLGLAYHRLGEMEWANQIYHRAQAFCINSGYQYLIGNLQGNLGLIQHAWGEYEEAVTTYLEVINYGRRNKTTDVVARASTNLGATYHSLGEHSKAASCFQQSIQRNQELGNTWSEAYTWNRLGHLRVAQGELVEAKHAYGQAEMLLAEPDALGIKLEAYCGIAFTALHTEKVEDASIYADKAWDNLVLNQFKGEWDWANGTIQLYEVFSSLQDDRTEQLLAMANAELNTRAENLMDETIKKRFLNQIENHRRIQELCATAEYMNAPS